MSRKSKNEGLNQEEKINEDIYVNDEVVELSSEEENKENIEENSNIEEVAEVSEENDDMETSTEEPKEDNIEEVEEIARDNKEEKETEEVNTSLLKKKNSKLVIILLSIILALVIAFVAIAVVNKMNQNVYKNVYLNNKNLSGMTNSELVDYLNLEQTKVDAISLKVLQAGEEILEIVPSDIDFQIDIAATQNKVFEFGRSSNFIKNNFDIIYSLISKKEFEIIYKYDKTKLSDIVKEIKESLNNKVIQDSFVVDEKDYKLIITRGKSGNGIEEDTEKKNIINALSNGMGEYEINVITEKPDPIDVDVVYSKVKREAQDAYIDKSTASVKFVPHQVGLDFDKKDLAEVLAKEENQKEEKVIEYKLTVTQPRVKTSDIKWDVYDYKISSFTTYFSTSDPNRVNNLRVALNLLNGRVIMPGEIFSYNSVVGAATAAQGFKPAATFSGGRVVSEVGGGICQTVSTLYNTALLANLEIVQRKAHSLPVAYVPGSRDATVYYPSIDFKFKNTRQYPIKIVTSFNAKGNLTISLFGTKEQNEYVVSISSRKTETIPCATQYINDSTLEKGKQVVVQSGSNGYKSEAYITKKLNGKVVSTTLLSKDTYKSVTKVVRVGTKEKAAAASSQTVAPANNASNQMATQTSSGTEPNNQSSGDQNSGTEN